MARQRHAVSAFGFRCCVVLGLALVTGCGTQARDVRIESHPLAQGSALADRGAALTIAVDSGRTGVSMLTAGESATATKRPTVGDDPALIAAIQRTLGAQADHYSVVVRRPRDGRGATLHAGRIYYAASLFKLALLYEAERQRSIGTLDFDRSVQVTARDAGEDLGTLSALGVGVGDYLPVRDAVQAMVTRSDNTSAVLLLYLLSPHRIDATLSALGLRDTSVNTTDLPTTATDMARLMEAVVVGRNIDPAYRDDMLRLLLAQETRSGIPSLLPKSVRVGNKTGTWPGATHDVAFVDAPTGTYIIAILSDLGWEWNTIARLSRAIYEVMTTG